MVFSVPIVVVVRHLADAVAVCVEKASGAEGDSTSLDAALALAERLGLDGFRTVYAALMNWKAHDPRGPASQTLPLALCIAILKAKAQGEGGHG